MAARVEKMSVSLGLDMTGFKRGLDKASQTLRSVGRKMSVASAGIVTGFGAIIKQAAATGDAFHKMSLRTGETVEDLSALKFAAERSGTSIETVETGILRLARNMNDTAQGVGEAKDSFERLGVEVTDANGELRSGTDVMLDVADALQSVESDTEKAAIAAEIFGRSAGPKLLPLLKEGQGGIEALMAKAGELGGVMSTEMAADAAAFEDAMTDMKTAMAGVGREIASGLLPKLTTMATDVSEAFANMSESSRNSLLAIAAVLAASGPIMLGLGLVMAHPIMAGAAIALAGVGAIVVKFVEWRKETELLADALGDIGEDLDVQTLQARFNTVTEEMSNISKKMRETDRGLIHGRITYAKLGVELKTASDKAKELAEKLLQLRMSQLRLLKIPAGYGGPGDSGGGGGGGSGGGSGVDVDAPARPNVEIFHDEDPGIVDLEIADTELVDQPLLSVPRTIEEIDASFEGFGDKFGNIAADMAMGINNFGDAFQNVAKQILRDIIAVIAKAIIMQAVMSFIPGGAQISFGSRLASGFGKLLGLADGGIVTGPTMAMIGEGSESEAVLPLSRLSQLIDSPSSGGPREAVFVVDGRELARGVLPHMPGEMNRMGVRRGV